MSTFDDPNREAVGQPPIWTGADEAAPEPQADAAGEQVAYDPGDDTVADVEAYVAANPDQRRAVLRAEKAGKNRTTLVAALEGEQA